ncbi:MAG: EamA family transporter [Streptococcus sp.]|uniref:EamA family transporter n=1 Tax=Streptococcus sp. TaxID=1306 RepID=UPI003991FBAA
MAGSLYGCGSIFDVGPGAPEWGYGQTFSNFAYITPFMAVLYSALLLNEPVDRYSVIGLLLIMGGIFVQMGAQRGAPLCSNENVLPDKRRKTKKQLIKIRMT